MNLADGLHCLIEISSYMACRSTELNHDISGVLRLAQTIAGSPFSHCQIHGNWKKPPVLPWKCDVMIGKVQDICACTPSTEQNTMTRSITYTVAVWPLLIANCWKKS